MKINQSLARSLGSKNNSTQQKKRAAELRALRCCCCCCCGGKGLAERERELQTRAAGRSNRVFSLVIQRASERDRKSERSIGLPRPLLMTGVDFH